MAKKYAKEHDLEIAGQFSEVDSNLENIRRGLQVMLAQHYFQMQSERMKKSWKERKEREANNNLVEIEGGK